MCSIIERSINFHFSAERDLKEERRLSFTFVKMERRV